MEKIAIIGYSGHAHVVLDACFQTGIGVEYYCAPNATNLNPYKLIYLGDESSTYFDWSAIQGVVYGIGSNALRKSIAEILHSKQKKVLTVIHPKSSVSASAQIGQGSFLSAGSIINAMAVIGDNCIINTGAIIEHGCKVGNQVHIAPGAVLAGDVQIGNNSFIGANAVIKQGIIIGENVTVGAGSVILTNIPDGEIWVGNPGKKMTK